LNLADGVERLAKEPLGRAVHLRDRLAEVVGAFSRSAFCAVKVSRLFLSRGARGVEVDGPHALDEVRQLGNDECSSSGTGKRW
jgi:hypothetical protein